MTLLDPEQPARSTPLRVRAVTVVMLIAGLIAAGTLLLKLPFALAPGMTLTWLDALFTAASAATLTGLTVVETASRFSAIGQTIIAFIMQASGLGVMIFAAFLMTPREESETRGRVARLVRAVVASMLLIELAGAVLMYPLWGDGVTAADRIGLSLFHSVSAFCNAGFTLRGDSLVSYRYAPLAHLVVAPLIVLGGLGFPVHADLRRAAAAKLQKRTDASLSRHTRLVLCTTAGLYLCGVAALAAAQLQPYLYERLYGATENRRELPPLTLRDLGTTAADASFMSITSRTAGFNTLPMDQIEPAARFTLMQLMFVGGSPGGTAGGVKTTTVAILFLAVVAVLRGRKTDDAVVRAAAVMFVGFTALIGVTTFLLCLIEPYPFLNLAFEAVSAATNTGLSLREGGYTAMSRCVLIAAMFLGRVGPLVLLTVARA
ncbi:MAG: hypothetical protein K8S99_12865 [Planctomycetes bacterium]|nr:hypothetical protein [Planctomycetota bacterium]